MKDITKVKIGVYVSMVSMAILLSCLGSLVYALIKVCLGGL